MPFRKGQSGNPAGRKKGSQNKDRLAWKELCTQICEAEDIQKALREACLTRPDLIFKAAEFAFGKPKQEIAASILGQYILPAGDDVAELDAPQS